jgi:hypothetical protein
MKWVKTGLALLAGLAMLSGCSMSIDGSQYKQMEPRFDLKTFFTGDVKAWGIVQNRSGNVVQRFEVEIAGSIKNDALVLDETFTYGVGEGPRKRIWTITENVDGTFTGKADDILNTATGVSHGNAFNFKYEMDLPVDDTTYKVAFNDWFWAFDENTMMNRAYISKFGIVMAEVTIFMLRQ